MKKQEQNKFIPAYTLRISDEIFLRVRPTANAWWKDQLTLCLLLSAISTGNTIEDACSHAGITVPQYKYFARLHPKMALIREHYKAKLVETSLSTIASKLKTNPSFALRYDRQKHPDQYPTSYLQKQVIELAEWRDEDEEYYLEQINKLNIVLGRFLEIYNKNDHSPETIRQLLRYARSDLLRYNKKYQDMPVRKVSGLDLPVADQPVDKNDHDDYPGIPVEENLQRRVPAQEKPQGFSTKQIEQLHDEYMEAQRKQSLENYRPFREDD